MNKKLLVSVVFLGMGISSIVAKDYSPNRSHRSYHAGVMPSNRRVAIHPRILGPLLNRLSERNENGNGTNAPSGILSLLNSINPQSDRLSTGGFNINVNNGNQVVATPVGTPSASSGNSDQRTAENIEAIQEELVPDFELINR